MPGKALKASRTVAATAFSPSSLFSGNKGGYWDVAQSHVWSDNGITQITDGGSVYRIDDLSGNGNHWLQTTSGNRPVWHANGGTPYIQFDGTDDWMRIALAANITGTEVSGGFAGRVDTGASNFGRFMNMAVNDGYLDYDNQSSFVLGVKNSSNMNSTYWNTDGPTVALVADADFVLNTALDATNQYVKKDNGARSSAAHGKTVNLNSNILRLGGLNTGVSSLLGRFYGGLIINRLLDATEMGNLATWLGAKQGRSI